MRFLRLLSLFLLLPLGVAAQSNQAPNLEKFSLTAQRVDRNIELRGNLSDPLWQSGHYVQLNYEIQPGDNTTPRQRSYATALYNSEYFYVGFRFYDTNPEEIRANISDRDRLYADDFAIAVFDTYGDYQRRMSSSSTRTEFRGTFCGRGIMRTTVSIRYGNRPPRSAIRAGRLKWQFH